MYSDIESIAALVSGVNQGGSNSRPMELLTVTPEIHTTVQPMVLGPAGTDFEDELYPRVGRGIVVEPRVRRVPVDEDWSEVGVPFASKIVRGPHRRPYQEGPDSNPQTARAITIINMTPYEYFECHHLTVGTHETGFIILGANTPVFRAEVTETITDTSLGAVKLGYVNFENLESGDSVPDTRWMEEYDGDRDTKVEIERPCVNYLGGGDISVGTKCLVEQEAGGLWTVVAVEC